MTTESIQSRKTEIRYATSEPSRMLGKWVARRVLKKWTEDVPDPTDGSITEIERTELLIERGTYIDQDVLCSIKFWQSEGSVTDVWVSNQHRPGLPIPNNSFFPYKASARIGGKKQSFLLYATSVANALTILTDYIELNCQGGFEITDIKVMDYCMILVDTFELQPDEDADPEEEKEKKDTGKFYQIRSRVVLTDTHGVDQECDAEFIVQTVSAARANILIQKYLQDKEEERYQRSLAHPESKYERYSVASFIEESKIIPFGCFIPLEFSRVYADEYDVE